MDQKKIDRINELYRKSKAEGLTAEEKQEQQKLRMEYRMAIVGNLTNSLKNVKIKNPDGSIVDLVPKSDKNEQKGH
ncbi:MAG: DUF896 domain-containing protein [Lachnospiraceae bacterium]|nr:DUF896 domain-containing protein [Lachnospiraceae bacterium]